MRVLTICSFLKPLNILMVSKVRNPISTTFKGINNNNNNYNNNNTISAIDLRIVSEDLGEQITNNLISPKNVTEERLTLNSVPSKFKELPTDKYREVLAFNKTVTL